MPTTVLTLLLQTDMQLFPVPVPSYRAEAVTVLTTLSACLQRKVRRTHYLGLQEDIWLSVPVWF